MGNNEIANLQTEAESLRKQMELQIAGTNRNGHGTDCRCPRCY